MHGGHKHLRGSGRRSVIPYVHGESVVLLCVWCCSSRELNLAKRVRLDSVAAPSFYSTRQGCYKKTQGPCDPGWNPITTYRVLMAMSSK
jgi:hypothetical protein